MRMPPAPPPRQVIGTIDGSGRVVLVDRCAPEGSPTPVDLDLEKVLGDMPNKTFRRVLACLCGFDRKPEPTAPLAFPEGTTAAAALDRRFLTTKARPPSQPRAAASPGRLPHAGAAAGRSNA
ncbi:hypothetical protein CHLNCDRAFT_135463 [Chlorella variabilis]|uniref:Uncharacterized protein n=1 Tax=Chlorella variabilis TaxID=554065 RepID=E1ZUB7_CHLVA|nr:hypothetical protein CHLNCDRAFT_135463 [Chlorella variabilis]EFN50579.1 hypothetical protein CHLNCDRAFT_135463 [Chlorella variabilis]|eukprot:XP_005842709.1 hypothetical protein CHLNCDRAFT_135463 [Chlorella variabilis]